MIQLLRADLYRGSRCLVFYVFLILNALLFLSQFYNLYSFQASGISVSMRDLFVGGMGGEIGFLGIGSAVISGVFVGREYACGAIRNKMIVGGGRSRIYLSKLIVCSLMNSAFYLVYPIGCLFMGGFVFAWGSNPLELLFLVLAGLFMVLAYSAIFTGISMFSQNTVLNLVGGILGVIIVSAVVYILQIELQGAYVTAPSDPETWLFVPCQWPHWVQNLVNGFIRLMPSGQSTLLVDKSANYGVLIALSCGWIVLSGAGGAILFRRVDIK